MENLHVNQNQSRLLIVNYGYNNNMGPFIQNWSGNLVLMVLCFYTSFKEIDKLIAELDTSR